MKQKSNFTFLLSYAKNEKYKLYLSAFLSVCSSILMVVPYILIYNIILELLKIDLDYNRIKKLAIYTAILIVLRLVLFILSGVFSHVAAFNILYNIRMQAVKHLGNIHLGYFREKNIGEIKKAINEDVETVKVGDVEVTEKGSDGDIAVVIWNDGTYSYAIDAGEAKLNSEAIANLIANIK